MIEAVLSNKGHPEYGVATIQFPIQCQQLKVRYWTCG